MTKTAMVAKSQRYPERLWEAAKVKADERDETLSDVLRRALEAYVKEDDS